MMKSVERGEHRGDHSAGHARYRQRDETLRLWHRAGHLRLLALLAHGSCNLSELAEKQAVSLPTMSNIRRPARTAVELPSQRGWNG